MHQYFRRYFWLSFMLNKFNQVQKIPNESPLPQVCLAPIRNSPPSAAPHFNLFLKLDPLKKTMCQRSRGSPSTRSNRVSPGCQSCVLAPNYRTYSLPFPLPPTRKLWRRPSQATSKKEVPSQRGKPGNPGILIICFICFYFKNNQGTWKPYSITRKKIRSTKINGPNSFYRIT